MTPACDEILDWIPLRKEDLDPAQREGLARHLEACGACRTLHQESGKLSLRLEQEALWLGRSFPAPARPLWTRALAASAAAAGLLLWAGLRESHPVPARALSEPPGHAQAPAAIREGMCRAETGDLEGIVGRSVLVALRREGTVRVSGTDLELLSGALLLDSPGEAVRLRWGEARVSFSDAALSLETADGPPRAAASASAWMPRAEAASAPECHLAVLRGEVALDLGNGRTLLRAGQAALLKGDVLSPEGAAGHPAWQGASGWIQLGDGDTLLQDAVRDFLQAPSGGGYVMEALIRKRETTAELGLRLAAPDGVYETPVGPALGGPETGWTRIRMECRGGWFRAAVGETPIVSCPAQQLALAGRRSAGRGVGLRAWGGTLEVKQVRWRPLT